MQVAVETFFEAGVPEWFAFQALANNVLAAGDSVSVEITVNSDFTPAVRSGELRITSSPAAGGNEPAVRQRIDGRLIVPLSEGSAALSGLHPTDAGTPERRKEGMGGASEYARLVSRVASAGEAAQRVER